jgi:gamma-glutamyltranspeptidase/glutathione hydrolase
MTKIFNRGPGTVFFLAIGLMLHSTQANSINTQQEQPEYTHCLGSLKTSYVAKDFIVATANPYATQIGYQILKKGGNAIDAAVAVQLILTLVEPQSSGIGGGAFLLYWNSKNRQLTTFDGRETAPAAATPNYFKKPDGQVMDYWEAVPGGRSVGVPGTVRLLEVVHQKYGRLDWAELFKPTIALAEKGFPISPRLAASIKGNSGEIKKLEQFPAARAYFFNSDGSPKEAGTVLKNPKLANTLKLIAEQGSQAFYQGAIAKDIVDTIKNAPINSGIITEADLAAYQVKERTPVCMNYREYQICGMGPPTSGGLTVGQMLGILSHFDLKDMGYGVDAVHLFLEAGKLAYADRALYLADADYVNVPINGLLDANYLKKRASLLNHQTTIKQAQPGTPPQHVSRWAPDKSEERPGTSHFVIRDRQGNVVSMTTTIETGFGSRLMVRGFLLNNELTDFSLNPTIDGKPVANRVEGGKRPRSSMSPTIVFKDDEPYLAIGSPGGSRIINYVTKTIVAIIDWGMLPQEAINLGHFVNRNGPTDLEEGTEAVRLKQNLEALGHQVIVRDLNSGLHAILMPANKLYGGADPRREGMVMGE